MPPDVHQKLHRQTDALPASVRYTRNAFRLAFLMSVAGMCLVEGAGFQHEILVSVTDVALVSLIFLYPAYSIGVGYISNDRFLPDEYIARRPARFWIGLVTYTVILAIFVGFGLMALHLGKH